MADLPFCEYHNGVLFLDSRGNCCACGAPSNGHGLLPVPTVPQQIAVLKVSDRLSAAACERIRQEWMGMFGPGSRLVILEEGMDLKFL
jgi:hypothetical protein